MVEVKSQLQTLITKQRLPHGIALVGGSADSRGELAQFLADTMGCHENTSSLLRIEAEGPQIKLEQAKSILDFLSLSRLVKARIVIISEAQTLNSQAANSLLKIIEEPPENSFFVCLTPSLSLLMPTLRSRLQAFRLPFAKQINPPDPELNTLVDQAWQGLLKRQRAPWNELVSQVKDRETAVQLAQLFQVTLRNAVVGNQPNQPLLLKWWRAAFQLELDIAANLDRTLLFENFYYQAYK